MLITYNGLAQEVANGTIANVTDDLINGASIDLTLGNCFYLEEPPMKPQYMNEPLLHSPVDLAAKQTLQMYPVHVEDGDPFILYPGQFCLASTKQKFYLPNDIAGHVMLKSSGARCGLNHLMAGWADPGWNDSVMTLEFHNCTQHHPLMLRPGMKVCQMVLWRGEEVPHERSYAVVGQYNSNHTTQPSKGIR